MAEKKNKKKKNAAQEKPASGNTADRPAVRSQKEEEKAAGIKKNPAGSQLRDSIIAVILIAFSIFTIIVLLSDTTGEVGIMLSRILKGLLGVVAYGLPFYLIIYAVLMLAQKVAHANSRTILFTVILILDFAMINSARFEAIRTSPMSLDFIKTSFIQGIELDSAGAAGMVLGRIAYKLVDIPGLIIIAIVILIISFMLVANTPISQFFDNLRINKNQKRINSLIDRTESGTSDPLKDTIPLPDLPVSEENQQSQSNRREDGAAQPLHYDHDPGKGTDNDNGKDTDNPVQKFRDFFSGFSARKMEAETKTIPLTENDEILNYMNDDSLFRENGIHQGVADLSDSSVERGLGKSYSDSADMINERSRREKNHVFTGQDLFAAGEKPMEHVDKGVDSSLLDQNPLSPEAKSGIDPDEEAFFDSMRRGLESLSASGKEKDTNAGSQDNSGDQNREAPESTADQRVIQPERKEKAVSEPPVTDTVIDSTISKAVKNEKAGGTPGKLSAENSETDNSLDDISLDASELSGQQEKVYRLPPVFLLNEPARHNSTGRTELREKAAMLEKVLQDFGVDARVINVHRGPSITRYEIQPATGVKVSSIVRLSDDIALNLRAKSLRIEAPIPGQAAIGIEVQNDRSELVSIREMIESPEYHDASSKISFAVGEDITGKVVVADLKKMPHMLIAGSTGSGKSVCINSILMSILYKATPDEVKLILIDPKVVELGNYNGIPHMLIPVVTDPAKASAALMWAVQEMEGRYKKFAKEKVKNLAGFNSKMRKESRTEEVMPQIVIIIDELADLMLVAAKQVEESICRLAQLARAAGMHMIVATQRPSVDVVTGLIKANVPSRIAFAVSSQVDSRTILDRAGAEKLVGNGDMLFSPLGSSHPQRLQGPFVSDEEVTAVIDFWKEQTGDDDVPEQIQKQVLQEINTVTTDFGSDDDMEDELYRDAVELIIDSGQASASMLQRRFRIGYNRAGRLIDTMEANGIIGPSEGSRPRKVLISKEEYESENKGRDSRSLFDDEFPEDEE